MLITVVDAEYKFLYVDIGAEGSASDGGTWKGISLYTALEENGAGLPKPASLPNDAKTIPYHFVGSDAFAMRSYLMKSFAHQSQLTSQKRINLQLQIVSRSPCCGECFWYFISHVGLSHFFARLK